MTPHVCLNEMLSIPRISSEETRRCVLCHHRRVPASRIQISKTSATCCPALPALGFCKFVLLHVPLKAWVDIESTVGMKASALHAIWCGHLHSEMKWWDRFDHSNSGTDAARKVAFRCTQQPESCTTIKSPNNSPNCIKPQSKSSIMQVDHCVCSMCGQIIWFSSNSKDNRCLKRFGSKLLEVVPSNNSCICSVNQLANQLF